MPRRSAGLLLHRRVGDEVQVLLGHPGGPLWARRDDGAWSIPKGEYTVGEDPWAAACREFGEELGSAPPAGRRTDLGELTQGGGKVVRVFAVAADFAVPDDLAAVSNPVELVWPRGSGRVLRFPELDRAGWFGLTDARVKLLASQRGFVDRLRDLAAP